MTRSNIEWTDTTWNPVVGCTRVSPACDRRPAVTMSHRLASMAEADIAQGADPGRKADYIGLTVLNPKGDRHFNGQVRCVPERLDEPLRWRAPRMVFTASMSDIFHERVPFEFLDRIFAVMALTPQHTYQVLTKRPERMAEYLTNGPHNHRCGKVGDIADALRRDLPWNNPGVGPLGHGVPGHPWWPLPNVWLMATVENQDEAERRIPPLLRCPAVVRGLSCEPLLGQIDLHDALWCLPNRRSRRNALHWVIAGGETAAADKARPTDDAWLRSLRDQCRAAGVPFFLKQRTERGRKVPIEQWPDDLRVREWPEAAGAVAP